MDINRADLTIICKYFASSRQSEGSKACEQFGAIDTRPIPPYLSHKHLSPQAVRQIKHVPFRKDQWFEHEIRRSILTIDNDTMSPGSLPHLTC